MKHFLSVIYTNFSKIFQTPWGQTFRTSLEDLADRMRRHNWGLTIRNKPEIISKEDLDSRNLHMTGLEMYQFITHFGILVGDLVPEGNVIWEIYLTLREIIALCTTTSINPNRHSLLSNLVQEHNYYARHVLKRDYIEKDHLLTHLSTVMKKSGPLRNIWAARFEAKF